MIVGECRALSSHEDPRMNLQYLKQRTFATVVQSWNWKDCALYAMGGGYGTDPLDERELDFVYEQRTQQVVPSFCVVLCWPEPCLGKPIPRRSRMDPDTPWRVAFQTVSAA